MTELTAAYLARKARGEKHPVVDFMFDYYSFRPGKLRRWHPGLGVALADAPEYCGERFYTQTSDGFTVDVAAYMATRRATFELVRKLLTAVADRKPNFGCFGMHEWAMVYGMQPHETRHAYLPLRFSPDEIRDITDSVGLRCRHFDAYRFFTPEAAPKNLLRPTRDTQVDLDQPGCLHVNMDLYRAAYKLTPLIPSAVTVSCFELAMRIREIDMRASPYDLSDWGLEPIRVETAEGRAQYVALQRTFSVESSELRGRILGVLSEVQ